MTSLIHASHGRKWPGILDVRRLPHSWGAGGRDQAKKQGGFYLEFSVRGTPSLLGELTIRTLSRGVRAEKVAICAYFVETGPS